MDIFFLVIFYHPVFQTYIIEFSKVKYSSIQDNSRHNQKALDNLNRASNVTNTDLLFWNSFISHTSSKNRKKCLGS